MPVPNVVEYSVPFVMCKLMNYLLYLLPPRYSFGSCRSWTSIGIEILAALVVQCVLFTIVKSLSSTSFLSLTQPWMYGMNLAIDPSLKDVRQPYLAIKRFLVDLMSS